MFYYKVIHFSAQVHSLLLIIHVTFQFHDTDLYIFYVTNKEKQDLFTDLARPFKSNKMMHLPSSDFTG